MSTVNAMIPLSYQSPQMPTQQDIYRNQLAQMQVQQAQQNAQSMNMMKQVFADPANVDEKGMPNQNAIAKIMQIDPEKGMAMQNKLAEFQQQQQVAQTNQIHQKMLSMDVNEKQSDKMEKIATQAQVRYDELIESGVSKKEATEIVSTEKKSAINDAAKAGFLTEDQATQSGPFDPDRNKAFIAAAPAYKTVLAERAAASKAKLDEQKETEKERADKANEAEKMKHDDMMNNRFLAAMSKRDQPDVPSGYRMTKDGNLEFIPGGPADPKTKQSTLGAREQVFLQRTMTSANEAAKDLENVVQLPMSSSTGWMGGRQQSTSILGATKEALANKLTSQEVQSYNTLSSGFQRSLASIEAAGLAPSGTLSHQMDSVIFKEGDTNYTKLEKLAQTRQIVEAGLESTLANPRIPEDQRKHMEDVMASIKKSVPFTQSDLIVLQNAQEKNPKVTLKDVMKEKQKLQAKQEPKTDEDKAAMDWAKAHADDPRAKKIMEMHGG